MRQRAKKHHLIPVSFLRRFADDRGRIIVRDKQTGVDRPPERVENVAVESHFYATSEADSDRVEQEVLGAQVEGPAKYALDLVIATDHVPVGSDRDAVALFLAVQYLRGRQFRAFIDGAADLLASQPGTPSPESTLSPEEFARLDRKAVERVRAESRTVDFKIRAMLVQADLVVPHLLKRTWTLVRGHDLITGDLPFVPARLSGELGFGLGIAVADFLVAPISPERALFLSSPGMLREGTTDLREEAQDEVRRTIWAAAERETYRNPLTRHPTLEQPTRAARRRAARAVRKGQIGR